MNVRVVVTVDADNDGVSTHSERTALSWRSLELIPPLAALFAEYEFAATWFVRADNQLADVYGRADHLLVERAAWWSAFAARGDEIGWHPHVYRRDDRGAYGPERDDAAFVAKLNTTWNDLRAAGHAFASARIGEAACSDAVMDFLDGAGLEADATAIPGRVRDDGERRFDWGPTPNRPYRPSRADYRIPGHPSRRLTEVPLTTARFRAAYDPEPMLRYVNPAYHPPIFRDGVERHFAEAGAVRDLVFAMVVHPDEVLERPAQHGLYAHALDAVRTNLATLREVIASAGLTLESTTVRGAAAACEVAA